MFCFCFVYDESSTRFGHKLWIFSQACLLKFMLRLCKVIYFLKKIKKNKKITTTINWQHSATAVTVPSQQEGPEFKSGGHLGPFSVLSLRVLSVDLWVLPMCSNLCYSPRVWFFHPHKSHVTCQTNIFSLVPLLLIGNRLLLIFQCSCIFIIFGPWVWKAILWPCLWICAFGFTNLNSDKSDC